MQNAKPSGISLDTVPKLKNGNMKYYYPIG